MTVPILALNGTLDLIVTPEQNLRLIAQTLEEVRHKDFITLEIPQLNHAFQTCKTGSISEYEKIEETTYPFVLNLMVEWLTQKIYKKSANMQTCLHVDMSVRRPEPQKKMITRLAITPLP